jgi:hypothetical protein
VNRRASPLSFFLRDHFHFPGIAKELMRKLALLLLAASISCLAQETPTPSFPYTPGFDWRAYLKAAGLRPLDTFPFSCKPGQPMVSERRCRIW